MLIHTKNVNNKQREVVVLSSGVTRPFGAPGKFIWKPSPQRTAPGLLFSEGPILAIDDSDLPGEQGVLKETEDQGVFNIETGNHFCNGALKERALFMFF